MEKAIVGKEAGNLPINAMALCIMAYCFMTTGIIMLSIIMFLSTDTSFLNYDEKLKLKNMFFYKTNFLQKRPLLVRWQGIYQPMPWLSA